ncbi:MAG: coenzyme F420-0:L-glutamate ligase, partial [Vicinamibacteria bacterium]
MGLPLVREGDSIARLVIDALRRSKRKLEHGDILVICQKIVSKAEGRAVDLSTVKPGLRARRIGARTRKDPHLVEIILRESKRVVRMAKGHL